MKNLKDKINFSEFLEIEKKLDIRIGTVLSVERIPKSNKMLKLTVTFGETERTVVTNIGNRFENPETQLKRIQFPFIVNLEPATIMGIVSEAMIMIVDNDGELQLPTDGQFTDGSKLL